MLNSLQENIDRSTYRMYHWLNTWCQEDGAYNSFVVHRYDLKRLKMIHDTPWGHCAVIEGLIILYEKTPILELKDQIEKAVRLQISRLDEDGSFINAGFEDDRFSSLVHNSMADRALLMYCCSEIANDGLKKKALSTVEKNVCEYLIGQLWNEEVGAFKFSKVDYYSLDRVRYVANMNCVAVEILIQLAHMTGKGIYLNYANRCGKWIKTQTLKSDNRFINGGISYGSTNPQNLVSIYTGLCLPGLCRLYEEFGDEAYRQMALNAVENLLTYTRDFYFCHSMEGKTELVYPYYIAGSGIILYGIQDVNETFGENYDLIPFVENVLRHQYKNGAVENFKHYNSSDNNRPGTDGTVAVWEDSVPCLPWNAQLFRFLAKNATGLVECDTADVCECKSGSYYYKEDSKKFFLFSWKPLRSAALIYINKKKSVSVIALSLKEMVGKIKKGIRK